MTSSTEQRKVLRKSGSTVKYVTKRDLKPRPSYRKGRKSASHDLTKAVIRDVAGYSQYERRSMELIRNSKDKKARKLVKKKLGTMKRAKRKMEELTNYIAEQRRTGH